MRNWTERLQAIVVIIVKSIVMFWGSGDIPKRGALTVEKSLAEARSLWPSPACLPWSTVEKVSWTTRGEKCPVETQGRMWTTGFAENYHDFLSLLCASCVMSSAQLSTFFSVRNKHGWFSLDFGANCFSHPSVISPFLVTWLNPEMIHTKHVFYLWTISLRSSHFLWILCFIKLPLIFFFLVFETKSHEGSLTSNLLWS